MGTINTDAILFIVTVFVLSLALPNVASAENAADVSAGASYSLLLDSSGNVWKWGGIIPGNTGNTSPTIINGVSGIDQISGFYDSPIMLKHDGTIWIAGSSPIIEPSGKGGGFEPLSGPKKIDGFENISMISASGETLLALRKDGVVLAWGSNQYGLFRNDSVTSDLLPILKPTIIDGLDHITMISLGGTHAVALKNDGTMWAWGLNNSGQLGIPINNGLSPVERSVPIQVYCPSGVKSVAAGTDNTAILLDNGTVWMWGRNFDGELGDGEPLESESNCTPRMVKNLSGIVAISAGHWYMLALKDDGTVWSWGKNSFGELGDGTTVDKNESVQVKDLTNIVKISAGSHHALAMDKSGNIRAWGFGDNGQLGDGVAQNYHCRSSPIKVRNVPVLTLVPTSHATIMPPHPIISPTAIITARSEITITPTILPIINGTPNLLGSLPDRPTDSSPGFDFDATAIIGCLLIISGIISYLSKRKGR